MVWPLGFVMRRLTSNNDHEIKHYLNMLKVSRVGTGLMHESFHKDDEHNFTRKWFAWANTLFGEFLWETYKAKPYLLS
jgi:meiotically up-regulated gene 157 (Mug157) protein